MSSTAFDRLQPGEAKSVYSFNEFCYTCRLYVTLHRGKSSGISPINDDFEESTGHAFDKSGSVQMTSSLQYAAVYLNGTENNILSVFSVYRIT